MISTNSGVGRQLLVAMMLNDEAEFVRILDVHCLQVHGNRFDPETEIFRLINQFCDAERALGLENDPASSRILRSELIERLVPQQEARLAA